MDRTQILKKGLNHINERLSETEGVFMVENNESTTDSENIVLVGSGQRYCALIQPWAPQQNFSALLKRLKAAPCKPILIADFVNPVMAEKLKRQSIAFVDCAGNMNLATAVNGIYVKGKKDMRGLQRRSRGRAFNPAGLRLVFAFFNAPGLLNQSYRNIASEVDVALGSIGPVLDDLQASGYIAECDGRKYLINKKRLFERWVDAYLEKLRPGLLLGRYRSPELAWWKDIDIRNYVVQWGGEITVAKQTPFLYPELTSVYCVSDDLESFVSDCGLEEDIDGDVSIYQAFWLGQVAAEEVSAMIVYADLIDSVDPGNWEVAKTFYGEKIAALVTEA